MQGGNQTMQSGVGKAASNLTLAIMASNIRSSNAKIISTSSANTMKLLSESQKNFLVHHHRKHLRKPIKKNKLLKLNKKYRPAQQGLASFSRPSTECIDPKSQMFTSHAVIKTGTRANAYFNEVETNGYVGFELNGNTKKPPLVGSRKKMHEDLSC